MKLRNKKTGEIKELQEIMHDAFIEHNEKSLMNLEKEWEDYEEPKEFWHISCEGKINRVPYSEYCYYQEKEIGNYFETREEAEKAVEKLKALKRLKDKGFKFEGWSDFVNDNKPDIAWFKLDDNVWEDDTVEDLDILFGEITKL